MLFHDPRPAGSMAGKRARPQTQAAVRDVDLPKELAALLSEFTGDRKEGVHSARPAANHHYHATFLATVCILRFSLSRSREQGFTAFGASANPKRFQTSDIWSTVGLGFKLSSLPFGIGQLGQLSGAKTQSAKAAYPKVNAGDIWLPGQNSNLQPFG